MFALSDLVSASRRRPPERRTGQQWACSGHDDVEAAGAAFPLPTLAASTGIQFFVRSTRARSWSHGIMPRSCAPTCSM